MTPSPSGVLSPGCWYCRMASVAKWSKAPVCGTGDHGFESRRSPQYAGYFPIAAPVAQRIERWASDPEVAGSNPAGRAKHSIRKGLLPQGGSPRFWHLSINSLDFRCPFGPPSWPMGSREPLNFGFANNLPTGFFRGWAFRLICHSGYLRSVH